MWHPKFLPLGKSFRLMDSHVVQVLLPRLKELEQSCHNLYVLLTRKKNAPCWQRGRRLLHYKLLRHQILVSQENMYIKKKHTIFHWSASGVPTSNAWSGVKACEYIVILFSKFEAKHQGHNLTCSQVTGWNPLESFTKSSCGNCDLVARSRLPTLKRGRGSSWEPKD
jgi:hypothetical protein